MNQVAGIGMEQAGTHQKSTPLTRVGRWTLVAALGWGVGGGCTDSTRPTDGGLPPPIVPRETTSAAAPDSGSAPESGVGSSPHSGAGESNWQRVKAAFGMLETVAGKGETDSGNEWLEEFEGAPALEVELARPHMAQADGAGQIIIADKESHAIRRVSPDGILTTVAGTNQPGDAADEPGPALEGALSNPNGVWVQDDGRFYIVDLGNSKIRAVSTDGQMRTLVTLDRLVIGRGLWVNEAETEALIADGARLLRWTAEAGVETFAEGFVSLGMVLRLSEDRIVVGDRGGHRVVEIDASGEATPLAGNGLAAPFTDGAKALETALAEPRAVWPYDGGFFVGLHDDCRVIYVDRVGDAHLFLDGSTNSHAGDGEPYDSPGRKIGEVRSVTGAPNGDLIIVENDLGYVRVVRAR